MSTTTAPAAADGAELRRHLAFLFDGGCPVALIDGDNRFVDVNDAWPRLLGRPREAILGKPVTTFAPPGLQAVNATRLADAWQKKHGQTRTTPLRHKDGHDVMVSSTYWVAETATQTLLVVVTHDVSGLGDVVDDAEGRYRALLARIPEVLWTVDETGACLTMSDNVVELLGRTPAELIGPAERRRALMHPDDLQRALEARRPLTAERASFDVELRLRHADGRWIWVRNRLVRWFQRDDVWCCEAVMKDVSEQHLLREQLQQAQRIAALGQLTGGIAHDFNNILSIILGTSEVLLRDLAASDPHRAEIDDIKISAEKAVALTRQLLTFSRRQAPAVLLVDINAVAVGLEPMLRRLLGGSIRLEVDARADQPVLRADRSQLEQIALNLVINARDAMNGQGRLCVRTRSVDVVDDGAVPVGAWVVFCVSDTGCGMDDETRARIFEPYFTTKDAGHGTGIGLATCKGIVDALGGHIVVDSVVGEGSRFSVYLPRVAGDERTGSLARASAPGGGGDDGVAAHDDDGTGLAQR